MINLESYTIPYAGVSTDGLIALVQTREQLTCLYDEYLFVKQALQDCVKSEQPETQEAAFIRAAEPLIQTYYVAPFDYERWCTAILKTHHYDLICLKSGRDSAAEQEKYQSGYLINELRRRALIKIDRSILRLPEVTAILQSRGVAV